MSYIHYKSDHVDEAINFLPSQFADDKILKAIISSFVEQIQKAEDALADMFVITQLDNATGMQLDKLGAIAGEPRGGADDATYKILIRSRIVFNRSSGCADTLIDMVSAQGGTTVGYEEYPGIVYLFVHGDTFTENFSAIIKRAAAAGIQVIISYVDPDYLPFTLTDLLGPEAQGGGLADLDDMAAGGGYLVSLLV